MGFVRCCELYRRGERCLSRAVSEDENKRYGKALELYTQACEYYLAGIAHDALPKNRKKVIHAVRGYVERAEQISAALGKTNKQPGVAVGDTEASRSYNEEAEKSAKKSGFNGVAGMKAVKRALEEAVILPALQPQAFSGKRKPWRGVLLYGPPGTGKSHIAAALSKEAKCTFLSMSSSDIVSKYQGESERAIKELFHVARKNKPCVIFLDEIDAIGRTRDSVANESARRVLTELLKQMEGVGSEMDGITVVGATNCPLEIDSALRRRFEKRIYVPMPGPKARAKILKLNLGDDPALCGLSNAQINVIAKQTDGYSGSDLANLANEALMVPVRECMKAEYFRKDTYTNALAKSKQEKTWWGGVVNMVSNTVDRREVVVPCKKTDPDAIKVKMMDPRFPCEYLFVSPVTQKEIAVAMTKIKPSVDEETLQQYIDFDNQFGSKCGIVLEDEDEEEDLADEKPSAKAHASYTQASRTQSSSVKQRRLETA
uniref:Vesicle-fusing ATPase n=1 Tax=Mucochytrium quahogii TaxID=96639 RepID=A0A7S2W3J8_9STRA|mmetsp:Transcript_19290/g.32216  ORF Transcript_19290/g.32216 Transcript_19290/m.32216 type:complete len:487 (+) Transcript_19290:75-1535(+)|eukprot:CAMPEP_0203756104 /NCGR_PEP_ID=MMETSP0098-20131031/9426_1 /ASSEMBLY_ACC=CAM_ASM_000208 /TAXON_ID=96639 /ORGANISM=" , Strain NY0313808BC1" /LENGTH=486 /DNA_ID=CAMNT_0050647827 /DNA_START=71 /DNA_END=1531 /DNA_ORIENTATION=-